MRARLVTTDEAAEIVGRSSSTIRRWVHLGYLAPYTLSDDGRPLYLDLHVYFAERDCRRRDPKLAAREHGQDGGTART